MSDVRDRLIDDTLALVSIPSVTGDEAAICTWIAEQVAQIAPEAVTHRIGNSYIVVPPLQLGRPTIGLFGHTDTVFPASDQPLGIMDERLYGCGASDMKASLAVMLELLREYRELTAANMVLVFYDKEEGPNEESGLIPVLSSQVLPPMTMALCLEPTDNVIQLGCMGSVNATVTVKGKRGHSARPWQGDNALTRVAGVLARVGAEPRREVVRGELTFYEVVSVTQAHTTNGRNVVPDCVRLNVNLRFAPGHTVEYARTWLEPLIFGPNPRIEFPYGISVELVDVSPAGAVCSDEPLLAEWRKRLALPIEPKQAWTDVARLTEAGISAANFGPGMTSQAHQAREHIPIPYLLEGHRILRSLLSGP